MLLLSQLLEACFDVMGKSFDEHQRPHLPGRGQRVAAVVEQVGNAPNGSEVALVGMRSLGVNIAWA